MEVGEIMTTLSVKNYGKGILLEKLERMNRTGASFGVQIAGMRERLKELGGRLEIQSDATGTVLEASVPSKV